MDCIVATELRRVNNSRTVYADNTAMRSTNKPEVRIFKLIIVVLWTTQIHVKI